MIPRLRKKHLLSLLPNRLLTTTGPAKGETRYLTFDDGPSPEYTPRVLDLLAEHDARASFFLVGVLAERSPDLVQRIVDAGHALGNHSWNHARFDQIDLKTQIEQIERCDEVLAPFDGRARHLFRPPRGVLPPALLLHCLRHRHTISYWSRDSMDYKQRDAEVLAEALDNPPPSAGEVVLMHDDSDRTIDMLAILLPRWRERGYRFDALPPMPA